MKRINLSNPTRAALRTAVQAFVAVFSISLLGWLASVTEWAGSTDAVFPSIDPLGKAAVAALVAAAVSLVTYLQNVVERFDKVPVLLPYQKPVENAVEPPAPLVGDSEHHSHSHSHGDTLS